MVLGSSPSAHTLLLGVSPVSSILDILHFAALFIFNTYFYIAISYILDYYMKKHFDWDEAKNHLNQLKHQVSFSEAKRAFSDSKRLILLDTKHSHSEKRYFCIGQIPKGIMTVRFTYRNKKIRIFGAALWRSGKKTL